MDSFRSSWGIGMQRYIFDHTKKGLQIGSLFGTFCVLPFTIYKDLKNLKVFNPRRLLQKQAATLTAGIALSYLWMIGKYIMWSDREQKLHE